MGKLSTEPALRETATGFQIEAGFTLERVGHGNSEADIRPGSRTRTQFPRISRSRMTLLGVLNHLWALSQLNRWGAGWKRDWWRVTQLLLPVIEQGAIGQQALMDCMYLVPELSQGRRDAIDGAWLRFSQKLAPRKNNVKLGIVLGEAIRVRPSKFGFSLTLRYFAPYLFFSDALRSQLCTSFPHAYRCIGGEGEQHVIAMCLVEMSPKGNLTLIEAALMATSEHFIPVDSGYETQLVKLLVDHNRSFFKPTKLETGESSAPDFVLTDTLPPTGLEVLEKNDIEYVARKAQKLDLSSSPGNPFWVWVAFNHLPPPPLPGVQHGIGSSR